MITIPRTFDDDNYLINQAFGQLLYKINLKFCNALSWVLGASPIGLLTLSGCTSKDAVENNATTQENAAAKNVHKEVGKASWYGPGFHGQETANGETFDQKEMTAAHPSLPMGTKAEVTNLDNGKKVEVRINDRGPFAEKRIIDVSEAAAKKLDMKKTGTSPVKVETPRIPKKAASKIKARHPQKG